MGVCSPSPYVGYFLNDKTCVDNCDVLNDSDNLFFIDL